MSIIYVRCEHCDKAIRCEYMHCLHIRRRHFCSFECYDWWKYKQNDDDR